MPGVESSPLGHTVAQTWLKQWKFIFDKPRLKIFRYRRRFAPTREHCQGYPSLKQEKTQIDQSIKNEANSKEHQKTNTKISVKMNQNQITIKDHGEELCADESRGHVHKLSFLLPNDLITL